ncbi:MAG: DNA polymerase III subunit delta [Pseudomonadota bacterium]|nr:DNA polymerase III subunit delta [Pseudomonadota bacterium]
MKIQPARADSFIDRPDPAVVAVLFYGPDRGLVAERAEKLARRICPDPNDPFLSSRLAGSDINADPARLLDEAAALSLMGGRRLVHVQGAVNSQAKIFERLLALSGIDSLVVIEAGELTGRDALVKLFESANNTASIGCWPDDEKALAGLLRRELGAHRITLAPDAEQTLARLLIGDRALARRAIEKLVLYAGENGHIEADDAVELVGDSAALSLDEAAVQTADGDRARLDRTLERLFAEDVSPVQILRRVQTYFQRLHLLAAHVQDGENATSAVGSLRPPVFWKLKPVLIRQAENWTPDRLRTVLIRLAEAEADCKRTGMPDNTLAARTLLAIAGQARRRRQS